MSEITKKQWDELNEKFEQLRLNEEMYRVAVGMTNHTISVVDIQKHSLSQIYNEGSWTGIAVTMEDVPESVLSTGIIHPDDCDGYREFYNNIYSGVPKGEYTMRVEEENRGWVWFTMFYQTVFDDNGKPLRAICFSDDITSKKRAEESYNQFKSAVTAKAKFVWEVNLTTNQVLSTEQAMDDAYGMGGTYDSYEQMQEIACQMIPDDGQRENARQIFSRTNLINAFESGKREVTLDFKYNYDKAKEGSWLRNTAYLMTDEQGYITGIMCASDITDIHASIDNLERKANRDSLTGLFNRAAFDLRADQVLKDNPDQVHGFMMIDVDDFKHFNDSYGHAFGDSVLQLVAQVLKDTFRSGDIIGRPGGDEFTVFMNGAGSAENILHRAGQIRRNLMDACRQQDLLMTVTVSVGVSVSEPGVDLRSMYLRADEAMYKSKNEGKDCVNMYE